MDNRRKNYVINRRFQYQSSLLVVALAVLLVNGFLILRLLFPGDTSLAFTTSSALAVGLVELLLVGSIWFLCIRLSHRVAGPVFVFTRTVEALGRGDLTASVDLRETDMFLEEAGAMNAGIAALRGRVEAIRETAGKLGEAQSAGGDTAALVAQLEGEIAQLTTQQEA